MPLEDADSAAAAAHARTSERRQPAAPAQPQPGADLCQHTPACRSLGANPQPPKPALLQARRSAEEGGRNHSGRILFQQLSAPRREAARWVTPVRSPRCQNLH